MKSAHKSLAAVALAIVLLMFAVPAGAATGRAVSPGAVPPGFFGTNLDGPLLNRSFNLPPVFNRMLASGVESVRVAFSWAAAQPVPNGPFNYTQTDEFVRLAAQRGMTVLPVVIYTPWWDAASHPAGTLAPPINDGPYAAYLQALVRRYGPAGSFWTQNPTIRALPIRMWQIWNEPNFSYYWPVSPFAPSYVALVQAAHAAIKQVDPGAKVVLAGMPDYEWDYLKDIYAVKGARQSFDVVAAHPYTQQPHNVIKFLSVVRGVMNAHGDSRKPLLVTETGWNSSLGAKPSDNFCCQTTSRGQARNVAAVLPLLASHRRSLHLLGAYFYTWASQQYTGGPSFSFAGLFNFANGRLVAKPAFGAFGHVALALEHCRRKGRIATKCVKPS